MSNLVSNSMDHTNMGTWESLSSFVKNNPMYVHLALFAISTIATVFALHTLSFSTLNTKNIILLTASSTIMLSSQATLLHILHEKRQRESREACEKESKDQMEEFRTLWKEFNNIAEERPNGQPKACAKERKKQLPDSQAQKKPKRDSSKAISKPFLEELEKTSPVVRPQEVAKPQLQQDPTEHKNFFSTFAERRREHRHQMEEFKKFIQDRANSEPTSLLFPDRFPEYTPFTFFSDISIEPLKKEEEPKIDRLQEQIEQRAQEFTKEEELEKDSWEAMSKPSLEELEKKSPALQVFSRMVDTNPRILFRENNLAAYAFYRYVARILSQEEKS